MKLRHPSFSRITINPEVCMGKPCIRGMRFPGKFIGDIGHELLLDVWISPWLFSTYLCTNNSLKMRYEDYIEINPAIRFGKPCILYRLKNTPPCLK